MDSLPTALDRVYASISRKPRPVAAPADAPPGSPAGSAEPWEALERLQTRFGLSSFERDVLVLLTGHSMESRFAAALGDAGAAPTFALALTALQNPHWSAISAVRPVRTTTGLARPADRAAMLAGSAHWADPSAPGEPLLLIGPTRSARERAFADICQRCGLRPYGLDASDIPESAAEREQLARLWTREAALSDAALYVRTENIDI